jgi:hypothetical protein
VKGDRSEKKRLLFVPSGTQITACCRDYFAYREPHNVYRKGKKWQGPSSCRWRQRRGRHVTWGRGRAGRWPVAEAGGGPEARGRGLGPRSSRRGPLIWICGNVDWSGPAAVPVSSLPPSLPLIQARPLLGGRSAGGAPWPAS